MAVKHKMHWITLHIIVFVVAFSFLFFDFKLGIGLQFENWSEIVALEVEIVAVGNFLVVEIAVVAETAAAVGKTAAAAAAAVSEQAGPTGGICFLSETPVGF